MMRLTVVKWIVVHHSNNIRQLNLLAHTSYTITLKQNIYVKRITGFW